MKTSVQLAAVRPRGDIIQMPHCEAGTALRQNLLLAALGDEVMARLSDQLELVSLPAGQVIGECGSRQYTYFPTSAVVSLCYVTIAGAPTEIAVIGNEGLADVRMVLGGESKAHQLLVQRAGQAFRIDATALKSEFDRGGELRHLLLRYAHVLVTQIAQTAACNRHHCLKEQLCRRLLASLDRQSGNKICITQEGLAHLLGVRRESVTQAAGELQRAGVLNYRRGSIHILDRRRLESMSCECYQVIQREFARLMQTTGTELSPAAREPASGGIVIGELGGMRGLRANY